MVDSTAQIDNSKAVKYAFALTGRRLSTHFIPRVSLRLPWAMRSLGFQPISSKNNIQILQTRLQNLTWSHIHRVLSLEDPVAIHEEGSQRSATSGLLK